MDMPMPTDDTSDMSQGYVIEITVTADGKISVGVESASEESQEEGGEGSASAEGEDAAAPADDADPAAPAPAAPADDAEPAEGSAMPAKNIKEALTMALEIFKNNGQAAEPDTSDTDFTSGYASK